MRHPGKPDRATALGSALPAAAIAASALIATGCLPGAEDSAILEPGISQALAGQRADAIESLRYAVSFDLPRAPEAPIDGRVTARFTLRESSQPLVLDFAPDGEPLIRSLSVNGAAADFDLVGGHIVIPAAALAAGEIAVEIAFRAGNGALTRNPEFLYTLFVPSGAHLVFPCFDQPDLKARYTLELTLPQSWAAVANGPEAMRETLGDRVRIRYAETEPIPTYLFAFAAGRFEIEEAERGGRTLRMFHRETDRAKIERNRAAIFDLHAAALERLEDYTAIAYPFAKFDFVLIPAFQFGGMEHPGAIFYRDTGILLEETATEQQRLDRATTISHETAHMWFGDLVTMEWFNDVWMKEVFANFMAARIVNPSFPDVNHELFFLTDNYPLAYSVDRTAGTHPIRQELANLSEAGSLYGPIIYQKAPIVMRQLERIVGPERFRSGVRTYLDRFRFTNASWLDLIAVLDPLTGEDLAAWSRAWVEAAGRPVIRSEARIGADGRIEALSLVQSDPVEGRALRWPQQLEVSMGASGRVETVPVELAGERVGVGNVASIRPSFALPTGGGFAYGDVILDEASRGYLLEHFTEFDALTRGAIWITLWEEMLDGRIRPAALMSLALESIPAEQSEQVAQLLVDGVDSLFWRFLPVSYRRQRAPEIERVLLDAVAGAESVSLKSACFSAFRSVVTTDDGVAFLARVWRHEASIAGLPLAETDETRIAEALALRSYPGAREILSEQLGRIENPDRRERFMFVADALSPDPAVRDGFFARLLDPANRGSEPWVIDGLRFMHHPLRAGDSLSQIRPALDELVEIRETGGIFLPQRWLGALLAGHNTPEAARIVRRFLDEQGPSYPRRLRELILQAADPLFRAVALMPGA